MAKEPKNMLKRIWRTVGLTPHMLILMIKFAIPPTIALAIYQDSGVAQVYQTLGYLPAIIAVLSYSIMPRSKFLQTISLDIIGICIGTAIALLQIYCAVQARLHTSGAQPNTSTGPSPGATVAEYNSSANAVSAVWLFFNIYWVNVLRAYRPQLQFPVIIYSIFAMIISTYAPSFPSVEAGVQFILRLFESFLTGFGIAIAVSLLVYPTTNRRTWFKDAGGFLQSAKTELEDQLRFFRSLKRPDMFIKKNADKVEETEASIQRTRSDLSGLQAKYAKLAGELAFTKREVSWGNLSASDVGQFLKHMQAILLCLTGLVSTADIFERLAKRWNWTDPTVDIETTNHTKAQWNAIVTALEGPLESTKSSIEESIQHSLLTLRLISPTKALKHDEQDGDVEKHVGDLEASAVRPQPGENGFAAHLADHLRSLHDRNVASMSEILYKRADDDNVSDIFAGHVDTAVDAEHESTPWISHQQDHQALKGQVLITLYIMFLVHAIGQTVLNLVQWADGKRADGTLKKKRLIVPGKKRLQKWRSTLFHLDTGHGEHTPDHAEGGPFDTTASVSFSTDRDPEHLPPTTLWQRTTSTFLSFGRVLSSRESTFGFRASCATLSIALIAFLEQSRNFFLDQRLVWSLIMVAIGMTATAGRGVFGFISRIAGTCVATILCFVIWYIGNGEPAGVLVMMWLSICLTTYFLIKFPRYTIVLLLVIVTQVLVIGYELQVQKLGAAATEAVGQPAYPVYELAPFRLACVVGGLSVAFFWTFFPYPLTSRSRVRRDVGHSLHLLANFYSIIHMTTSQRIRGREKDCTLARTLEKERRSVYTRELTLLGAINQHIADTVWEPTFGGAFPRTTYKAITTQTSHILNYLSLISFASNTFSSSASDPSTSHSSNSAWQRDFQSLMANLSPTSQSITTTLTLLANAVTTGTPLPPDLQPPPHYSLLHRLEELDHKILGLEHVQEEGYAAFAVMQIASSLVRDDLARLIEQVRELVGEVDFRGSGRGSKRDKKER